MIGLLTGRSRVRIAAALLCAATAAAFAQTRGQPARGELLYSTHCIACHTAQIHWRDRKLAKDWAGLRREVRRWADSAGLGWTEEEVADVARYLNAAHYRFEAPALTERSPRDPARAFARAG